MTAITWDSDRQLDLRGLACPLPVLKARKALIALAPGGRLQVEASDPLAAIDIPHFCREAGHTLLAMEKRGEAFIFLIERGRGGDASPGAATGPTRR